MSTPSIERDERTITVENASYRCGSLFMSFGVLALVAYRSFARNEANRDLLALVVLGGFVPEPLSGLQQSPDGALGQNPDRCAAFVGRRHVPAFHSAGAKKDAQSSIRMKKKVMIRGSGS